MGIKQFLAYLQRSDDSETLVAALGNELGDWRESLSQLLDVEDEQGRSSVGDPQDQPKLAIILSHLTNQHHEYFSKGRHEPPKGRLRLSCK